MNKFKKICLVLLFPHGALIAFLIPVSAALLLLAFLEFGERHVFSYVAYLVSAYTLTIICTYVPTVIKQLRTFKNENKYAKRLIDDVQFRLKLSLYLSLFMNTAYAAFQFMLGRYHHSFWFYMISEYYIFLVVVRFFLVRDVRRYTPRENMLRELKRYRFCGIVLMLMNAVLGSIVAFMIIFGRNFTHHFATTIGMAAFTFTVLTVAIVSLIRYRKYQSPVFTAAKIINLVSAVVSFLPLTSAMLTEFGAQDDPVFRKTMIIIVGACVCSLVIVLATFMIIHSNKEIKNLKECFEYGREE